MRTREKKLIDYESFFPEEEERLRRRCITAEGYDRDLLFQICQCVAPGLGNYIFASLTIKRNGYDTQMRKVYIPATKADFYGYQRKVLDEFYRMLKLLGRWKE